MRPERGLPALRRRSHHHPGGGRPARHLPLGAALGLSLALAASACDGEGGPDGGQDAGLTPDSGAYGPPHDPGFNRRAQGWPADAGVVGAAVVDSVLTVATPGAALSMDLLTTTDWTDDGAALAAGERFTSVYRLDRTLYATVASATGGGLLVKAAHGTWQRVAGTPAGPAWALSKRGPTVFLVAGTALWVAADPAGPWTRRSPTGAPLFAHPLRWWVAAPAQQRIFAAGDPAFGVGGLSYSNDEGASWQAGLVGGDVLALGAGGPVVLVRTTQEAQRSDNYGGTFHPTDGGVAALDYVFGPTRVWAPTATGVMASDDLGLTWVDHNAGLPAGPVRSLHHATEVLVADTPSGPYLEWL